MRQAKVMFGFLATASLVALTACNSSPKGGAESARPSEKTESAPAAERSTVPVPDSPAALVERGQKELERGGDASAARDAFERVLADASATSDEMDEARLGLSQAREILGDQDGAVAAVEEILSGHADSSRFATRDAAEKRLRKLLTGREDDPTTYVAADAYAPVARALAPYFQPDDKKMTLIDVYAFGERDNHANELGIFNIAEAKRDMIREACEICEHDINIGRSISASGSWTAIPRAMGDQAADMPQIDRSLLVFFFDLDGDRVPSRYDEYLPIPSDEIVSHLEKGEGLVAMRERKGAKPTIVIAAPRVGQLREVEDAFAKLTELPKEPLVVNVSSGLTKDEIRGVVRSKFGGLHTCYEELLKREPSASGKVELKFAIEPSGEAKDVELGEGTTLSDPTFDACTLDAAKALRFPETGARVKVTYPVAFSP